MLFQAARHGAQPLALAEDDEDEETAIPRARAGAAARWRNIITAGTLVCVAVAGTVVLSSSVALRAGWLGSRGTAVSPAVLKKSIAAVVVDVAKVRRMEGPGLDANFGEGDSNAFEVEPHGVEWPLSVRKESSHILESQKFRLVKHIDSRITLRDRNGLHLDVADNRSMMRGGVTTQAAIVATNIGETGKFTFVYNFDSTVSLRQPNNQCLTTTEHGVHLLDCDANGGAGSTFTPQVMESEGVVAFKTKAGNFLTVIPTWVQDYKTSLKMVDKKVALQTPFQCGKFHRKEEKDGLISLKTRRATYLTSAGDGVLHADATKVSSQQMFTEIRNDDGSVSLSAPAAARKLWAPPDSSPRRLGLLEADSHGAVRATGQGAGSAHGIVLQENSDGTVSLTRNGRYVCVAERSIRVATCETRGHGAYSDKWPMQGVSKTMPIKNVCAGKQWYGFKTKVDAYQKFAADMAKTNNDSDQIIILVDNSDMAFGGCGYDELLYRYDLIRKLTNATVIAGADNAPYPTSGWPYSNLQGKRQKIMQAFGMKTDQFCDVTECPRFSYQFANSGFLMGSPRELYKLLGCMREGGFGNFGRTGFDDQQGLQVCMFGDYKNKVALDYTGTITMELIRMHDNTLYEGNGKVYNRVARGMSQCFVHGNGDTMKFWWPRLFPGLSNSEDYGKNFMT